MQTTCRRVISISATSLSGVSMILALAAITWAQGLDTPTTIKPGATFMVDLFEKEAHHFRISLPAGQFKAVLDSRRSDGQIGNINGSLSILNRDGVVVTNRAIWFNAIDNGCRGVYTFSLKTPTTMILKLSSAEIRQKFWLTILSGSTPGLVPFFDEISPKALTIGQPASGTLSPYEFVYYTTRLTRGDYKVVLDFEVPTKEKSNLTGYLASFDGDGGNQTNILGFNEIDTFSRQTGTFAVRADTAMVFKIQCGLSPVQYNVTIQPNSP